MRILYLSLLLPYPLDSGAKFRTYYLLRYLATRHEITFLTFIRQTDSPQAIDYLKDFCEFMITVPIKRKRINEVRYLIPSLLTRQPFTVCRTWRPEMMAWVEKLLSTARFDILHVDQLPMASYVLSSKAAKRNRVFTVLEEANAEFMLYRRMAEREPHTLKRWFLNLESHRLAQYERMILFQFDRVVTVTPIDRQFLLEQAGEIAKDRLVTIPVCTDPDTTPLVGFHPGKPNILSVGTMNWPPNVDAVLWFAKQVLPIIKEKIPDVTFTIVGKNPPPQIRALQRNAPVIVTGYVDDLTPYLLESGVFVVPILAGSGMRVKIVDMWTQGIPIVSTTIGAEGLIYTEGQELLIADKPEAFADAVIRILQDQELASRLRYNGRKHVEVHYNWRVVYRVYDDIFAGIERRKKR